MSNNFVKASTFLPEMFIDNNNKNDIDILDNINNFNINLEHKNSEYFNDTQLNEYFNIGDNIKINANISEKINKENYCFKWSIEANNSNTKNSEDENWVDISNYFRDITKTEGIGILSLNFKLNLSNKQLFDIFKSNINKEYIIRIKLNVSRIDIKNNKFNLDSSILIKFKNINNPIMASLASVDDKGKLLFDKNFPICVDKGDFDICSVTKDEIIALNIDNYDLYNDYEWTINNDKLKCEEILSTECEDKYFIKTVFFPITGEVGDKIDVSVKMKNVKNGLFKTISKKFLITKPQINIDIKNNDKNIEKFSASNQIKDNSKIYAKIYSKPSWIIDRYDIIWSLDGNEKKEYNNKRYISFILEKKSEDFFDIKIEAIYKKNDKFSKDILYLLDTKRDIVFKEKIIVEEKILVEKDIVDKKIIFRNSNSFIVSIFSDYKDKAYFIIKVLIISTIFISSIILLSYLIQEKSKENN